MNGTVKVRIGRRTAFAGRRVRAPLIRRQPAGDAYWREPYRRLAYMRPVPSIRVLLLGPVWMALTVDPKAAQS